MQSSKAITVVIVAMVLTGMCGYLLQTSHEDKVVTTYTYKGDTTPSVIYSDINDWLEFNPLSNVTGWSSDYVDDIVVPISENVATPYLFQRAIIGYDDRQPITTEFRYETFQSYTILSDYNLSPIANKEYAIIQAYDEDGELIDFKWAFQTSGIKYFKTIKGLNTLLWNPQNQTFSQAVRTDTGQYVVDQTSQIIDYPAGNFAMDWFKDFPDDVFYHPRQLSYALPQLTDPVYMDSTKFIQVNEGKSANWSNNQVNGVVNVLVSKNAEISATDFSEVYAHIVFGIHSEYYLYGYYYPELEEGYIMEGESKHMLRLITPASATNPYPVYEFTTDDGTTHEFGQMTSATVEQESSFYVTSKLEGGGIRYTYSHYNHKTTEKSITLTIPDAIPYDYVLCTLDFRNNTFVCKGITSITNTLSYTLDSYEYTLDKVALKTLDSVKGLIISAPQDESSYVFIDSTVVAIDPDGLLWGNPDMPLKYYYSEQMTHDTRLLFNGFVKYGDSITINGEHFDVVDGKLEYTHDVDLVPSPYPKIEVGLVAPSYETGILPNHALLSIAYQPTANSKIQTNVIDVGFENDVANVSIPTSQGDISMSIKKLSNKYSIVVTDRESQKHEGEIPLTVYGTNTKLIKVPQSEKVTEYLPLKGMAVDFIKKPGTSLFTVNLVFTEAQNYTISLGDLKTSDKTISYDTEIFDPDTNTSEVVTNTITTPTGFLISASGTWYWQAGLYTVSTESKDSVGFDITSGVFGLSLNAAALLMIFFTIIGTAGYIRITGSEFQIMDWLVLIAVDAILITVAIF